MQTATISSSLIQKINQAYEFLKQSGVEKWPSVEEFTEAVRKMGGTSVALLAEATWEDIESGLGVPRLIARGLAKVFRTGGSATGLDDVEAQTIMAHKPMTDWPVELVLAKLDPAKPNSPEAKELARRFGVRPILVFDANGVFDFAATRAMVERAEKDEPETDLYSYPGGVVVTVYAAGFGPFRLKDACPLHPDTPLVDGRCYRCQAEWGGLSKEVRQAVHYVLAKGLIDPSNRPQVYELFGKLGKEASVGDQLAYIGAVYPEAMQAYRDAKARGKVEPLVLDLGTNGSVKRNNPFGNKQF